MEFLLFSIVNVFEYCISSYDIVFNGQSSASRWCMLKSIPNAVYNCEYPMWISCRFFSNHYNLLLNSHMVWFSSHLFFDLWFKSNENMNSLDLKRKELFYFITRNKFKHMIHSLAIQMYWNIYWPSKDFHPYLLIITIHISPFLKDTYFNAQYNDSNSR